MDHLYSSMADKSIWMIAGASSVISNVLAQATTGDDPTISFIVAIFTIALPAAGIGIVHVAKSLMPIIIEYRSATQRIHDASMVNQLAAANLTIRELRLELATIHSKLTNSGLTLRNGDQVALAISGDL